MKIYLVGGAVRDQFLGLPQKERDYVVVGSSVDEMLKLGFKPVGKDFPVFLHPKTHEEYALARTERKINVGYHGFTFYADPSISLNEDLKRRDLTINAMALDETGQLIDPYHGLEDLHNKILRHVSPAFIEDPVRVLRLARLYARFYHLEFRIADETLQLIQLMIRHQELDALVPERIWQETNRALNETHPEQFFYALRAAGALKIIFPELNELFGIPLPPNMYPWHDAGIQSLKRLATSAIISTCPEIRFASLCLYLGKTKTPIAQWPDHTSHTQYGLTIVNELCTRLRIPLRFKELALLAIEHQNLFEKDLDLTAGEILTTLITCDAFRRPERFEKLLKIYDVEYMVKINFNKKTIHSEYWLNMLRAACSISVKNTIQSHFDAEQRKEAIFRAREIAIQKAKETLIP